LVRPRISAHYPEDTTPCQEYETRQDTHWTRVIPKTRHDEVRAALLHELGFSQSEWEAYHDGILRYRNELVAHHDHAASVAKYPHYDKAIVAATFMFNQLRDAADPDELGGILTSLDRWSSGVAENMSVIVRKAFQACASLGSNVPGAAYPAHAADKRYWAKFSQPPPADGGRWNVGLMYE